MSNDNKSIHDFDLSLIVEYYSNTPQQGPGSPETTLKVLSFIDNLTEDSKIVDIGCGTGGQTQVLAQYAPAPILGIDLFPVFIDLFNENANSLNLQDQMKGIVGSMNKLPFLDKEIDLIWSEGAIYNIGFEKGLKYWRRFLKTGGYIAVSEASWFTEERPKEIEDFWNDAYPGIDTIANKVDQMQKVGYKTIAAFAIPDSCWIDNFYAPQVKIQEDFLIKKSGNKAAEGFIANQRHETDLYRKYKDYYGYVFYIGKKI
ncbi:MULTISPECIES: class I SAM-dependent methyltransferase [unclassified Lentimicrobium]|uniref:class I SAM-dependent methyltransferase n=1 Tax=unclassified Lentimicrobium TaxID=2677434 RepID=UPI00155527E2|nr:MULTISPECIES: class I SAM-dependent methyltransferase [unclassified Lentimicrobium]NPD47787.1 class I SAM-dependent methyltransferase [Lentimicrobium sp. S6]NPD86722.1 class I SAM-dependent methyltransferase [Lentimicrobium sp. L6]